LSGPTFAKEVGAVCRPDDVASPDEHFAKELAQSLSDPISARTPKPTSWCGGRGAVKNVIAIGSGIADGMGYGANTAWR